VQIEKPVSQIAAQICGVLPRQDSQLNKTKRLCYTELFAKRPLKRLSATMQAGTSFQSIRRHSDEAR
jgi:hypothetical protein